LEGVHNYRIISFDVLSGILVVAEMDRIIFDTGSGFVYGVEYTRTPADKDKFQKALQALALSTYFPWLPYRVESQVARSINSPYYRSIPLRLQEPHTDTRITEDHEPNAEILDLVLGEIAQLAKLLAVSPAPDVPLPELNLDLAETFAIRLII